MKSRLRFLRQDIIECQEIFYIMKYDLLKEKKGKIFSVFKLCGDRFRLRLLLLTEQGFYMDHYQLQ